MRNRFSKNFMSFVVTPLALIFSKNEKNIYNLISRFFIYKMSFVSKSLLIASQIITSNFRRINFNRIRFFISYSQQRSGNNTHKLSH